MVGQTIGSYTVKSPIGSGGMGTVFLGMDNALERPVAIKVLSDQVTQDPVVLQRFRSEAVTLARLSHPNIANVYNFIHQDDKYMLIMEFVEGETLEQLLRRLGALKPGEAAFLVGQALLGLAHAHSKGIIHRDVKPANLMMTREGVIKLTDFGIARVQGSTKMTSAGKIVGTPDYMSPEQIQYGEVDARSDIYSMGIVLYELLAGKAPFTSTSEYEVMRSHVEIQPRPVRELNNKVAAGLEKVLIKSLAKKPDERFQNAMDFRAALAPFVVQTAPSAPAHTMAEGVPAYVPSSTPSGPRTPAKGVTRNPSKGSGGMIAMAAVAGIVVVGGGVWFITKSGKSTPTVADQTSNNKPNATSTVPPETKPSTTTRPHVDPNVAIQEKIKSALAQSDAHDQISQLRSILHDHPDAKDAKTALEGIAANNIQEGTRIATEWNAAGTAQTTQQLDDAIEKFEIAAAADPESFKAHYNLAGLYNFRKDLDKALAEANKAAKLPAPSRQEADNLKALRRFLKGG